MLHYDRAHGRVLAAMLEMNSGHVERDTALMFIIATLLFAMRRFAACRVLVVSVSRVADQAGS